MAMTALSYGRVWGANDTIAMGVIGCGGRGRHVTAVFAAQPKVRVAAACDVFSAHVDMVQQKAPGARGFSDHRRMLEMKELDCVLVATPDHWHAEITIDALEAGKDVYVEKPLTLTIDEGPQIVRAARVNQRICQVGMQRRSSESYHAAKRDFMPKLGKVTLARTWWHGNGAHLRKAPPELRTKPDNLDWGRYLGRVKWREYDPQMYWNFRAYLEFGGGQVTDLFTHWVDMVHLFVGEDVPVAAVAAGGIYHYKDGRTAPDTICVLNEYPGGFTATFEATLAPGMRGTGMELCGTEGRLLIAGGQCEFHPAAKGEPPVIRPISDSTEAHVANFLDCVRSRKLPNADVLIGHRSAQASHLGNIAYLERRRIKFDPVREEILPL